MEGGLGLFLNMEQTKAMLALHFAVNRFVIILGWFNYNF